MAQKTKHGILLKKLRLENKIFSGINLSKNRGHQNALLAGLLTLKDYADAIISFDADLQDDVVYGVRSSRKTDTIFKEFTIE